MGIKSGRQYIEQVDEANTEVWYKGERIQGPISEHPAFRGVMSTQAELYDKQARDTAGILVYKEEGPSGPEMFGMSFLPPRTREDLIRRRIAYQEWAYHTNGFMGRTPDYMNTVIMLLGETAELLEAPDRAYADHARWYRDYCKQKDLTVTHTFIRPQTNRSRLFCERSMKDQATAQIIDKTPKGIVVSGALLLATQGGMTDEIFVFPGPVPVPKGGQRDNPYAFAFAIPCHTPGLKFICRDSYVWGNGSSSFDAPLSSRYEEMDTAVLFDKVLVPWERVFLCGDAERANQYFSKSNFYGHLTHQVISRRVVKLEFMLGLAESMVRALSISEYLHIQEKVSEVILAYESIKAMLTAAEAEAQPDEWGLWAGDYQLLNAACLSFNQLYPRITEILQLIGASGLVAAPSEADLRSVNRELLEGYLATDTLTALERTQLFRLVWDATMSPFGTRQTLYERMFLGDPARLAGRYYNGYGKEYYVNLVQLMLERDRH